MKMNHPITQVERPFPRGKYVVSKTDLKGAITYVNETFVELSGFPREELLGKNHNIVRHPEMPPAAFADLWATVKAGHPWRGIVKNRCKNGDYYWVDAFVVPVRENDQTVGYMSVRSEPSRSAVEKAETLYRQLMQGKKALSSRPPLAQRISLRTRLLVVMGFLGLMLLVGAAIGIGGNALTNDTLENTYTNRLDPVDIVGRITILMGDNRGHVMQALQHNPASPFTKPHEYPLALHTDAIIANRNEITTLVGRLDQLELSETLKPLLERYAEVRSVFVKEGLLPARQAILDGQYDQANEILLKTVNPTYIKAATSARELQDALKDIARKEHQASQERYRLISTLAMGGTVVALLLVALATWNLLRAIVNPLNRVVAHFDRISQGNLTDEIDISGRDEAGRVLTMLAAMQVHLKIMLDEIQVAARTINTQAAQVEWQTNSVVEQSVQQRDGAASVAAATEEFSQSVREVADSAGQAAGAAESAQAQVMEAQASMEKSTVATGRVADAVQSSSRTIADLDQAIAKIGGITQIIKEIAEQTNLLALNAAIEAARAGDMGRGFAVVADEVRKLAERTTASTADITATVTEIRQVTDASVASMGHAVAEVEEGIGMINASMSGLGRITGTSQEVNDMARHIAAAAGEQAIASEQVANSMERIAGLIDENLVAAQGAKESVDALKATAQDLDGVVGRFKVIA